MSIPSTAHGHEGEEPCFTAIIDGLTKRELFAAMILAAFSLNAESVMDQPLKSSQCAIVLADALIAELAKPEQK